MRCPMYKQCHENLGITEERLSCLTRDFTRCHFFMLSWLDMMCGYYTIDYIYRARGVRVLKQGHWCYRGVKEHEPWLWCKSTLVAYDKWLKSQGYI